MSNNPEAHVISNIMYLTYNYFCYKYLVNEQLSMRNHKLRPISNALPAHAELHNNLTRYFVDGMYHRITQPTNKII